MCVYKRNTKSILLPYKHFYIYLLTSVTWSQYHFPTKNLALKKIVLFFLAKTKTLKVLSVLLFKYLSKDIGFLVISVRNKNGKPTDYRAVFAKQKRSTALLNWLSSRNISLFIILSVFNVVIM